MMNRMFWLDILCILVVIALGGMMFVLKYHVIGKERKLAQIHRQILTDKREIHMLNADWALLNDPERIRILVENQTDFKIIKAAQIVTAKDLPDRVPVVSDETVKE